MQIPDTDIVVDLDDTIETAAPARASAEVDEDDDKILPKGCERNADGSVTVRLLHPRSVTTRSGAGGVREERFDTLTFHRLTGADLNAVRATSPDTEQVVLFTRSSRVRSAVMQVLYPKLDAADIMRCGRVLNTFL